MKRRLAPLVAGRRIGLSALGWARVAARPFLLAAISWRARFLPCLAALDKIENALQVEEAGTPDLARFANACAPNSCFGVEFIQLRSGEAAVILGATFRR